MSCARLRFGIVYAACSTALHPEIGVEMPLAACPWRGAEGVT